MRGATPQVGPFSALAARPYSSLDVGLDFQASLEYEFVRIWTNDTGERRFQDYHTLIPEYKAQLLPSLTYLDLGLYLR